ncbi:NACHT domain-containing protein [Trichoderma simmonsii]|uniref:NACHT domain-containing protein n=1 Tax=Trichoderma simmonsii TaxID=1491479 RepID=A0A8G0L432_9HYPO|nr:NACHT domain-containing protein [Trichoderma simmonsii]
MEQQSRGVVLNQVNIIDARDGEPDVDIIAIHGLDTKSPDTWTWRSQDNSRPDVNWLADPDMLPSKMKQARIFTCDWPADLFQESDSIPWAVREFARRLLAGIHNMRVHSTADGRGRDLPVVFIASCLGGIILMEALTIADSPQSDYVSIRKATRGIVFLATPFRGTAFQDIASWAEPVLKTWALLRKGSVTQLLESVKRSTFYLEELVRTFTRVCQDKDSPCKVHTFYETRETILPKKFLPSLLLPFFDKSKPLVNSSSATLDIDSDPLPLERSHVMMNKFAGPDDPDYITVTGRLDALLQLIRHGLQQVDTWMREKNYTADRLQIERLSGQRLPMDQCYINLVIIERLEEQLDQSTKAQSLQYSLAAQQFTRRTAETYHHRSEIELSTIFSDRKGHGGCVKHPRRILIRGRAGVGKTTLCKKIVFEFYRGTWTEWNKNFNRILWVPLRNLKLQERMRPGYNYECLFSDEYFSLPENRPDLAKNLSKAVAAKNNTTLFLLDGLDEVSEYLDGEDIMSRFLQDLLKQPNVIITSRPSATPPPGIDLELETVGFDDTQVNAYLDADLTIKPNIDKVKSFLQDHWLLQDLVRIPVQLDALCYTWDDFDSGISPDSMTCIYQAIEQKLWKKDAVRLERILKSRAQSALPVELENRVKAETKILEILAFHGMYHNIINFTSTHLDKVVPIFPLLELTLYDTLGRLSFLRTSDSSSNFRVRSYHFIHLTFQEYFAARYFVQHWTSGEQLSILDLGSRQKKASVRRLNADKFLKESKYSARYDIFWRFVTGLLYTGYEEEQLRRFFLTIEDQPRDLLGPVHQRLVMHCLSEVGPSDGMESFAHLRRRLEEHLSQWLEFECEFRNTSLLIREIEFPERSLNSVLQRATEDMRIHVLGSLKHRPKLPQMIIELMTAWLEESLSLNLTCTILSTLHSCEDLPLSTLNAIIGRLNDEYLTIREAAAGLIRTQRSLPEGIRTAMAARFGHQHSLHQLAIADALDDIRRQAILALRNQHSLSESILEYIVGLLEDEENYIRGAAWEALYYRTGLSEEILEALAAWLVSQDRDTDMIMLPYESELESKVLELLIPWLEGGNTCSEWKLTTLQLLQGKRLPMHIIRAIAAQLEDQNKDIRREALNAIGPTSEEGQTFPVDILQATAAQLTHPDKEVKEAAFKVLSRQPTLPDEILNVICRHLHDQGPDIRCFALSALGNQPQLPSNIIEVMATQLKHRDHDVRKHAASALKYQSILSDEIVWALATQLMDQSHMAKLEAARALYGRTLSKEILEVIAELLTDPSPDIRLAALRALLGKPTLPERVLEVIMTMTYYDDDIDVMIEAIEVLGTQSPLSEEIFEAIVARLGDCATVVQSAAIETLRSSRAILPQKALQIAAHNLYDQNGASWKAAVEILQGNLTLADIILKDVASYRALLETSFVEHATCCAAGSIFHVELPGSFGDIFVNRHPDQFMDTIREWQRELGIPPRLDHRED